MFTLILLPFAMGVSGLGSGLVKDCGTDLERMSYRHHVFKRDYALGPFDKAYIVPLEVTHLREGAL